MAEDNGKKVTEDNAVEASTDIGNLLELINKFMGKKSETGSPPTQIPNIQLPLKSELPKSLKRFGLLGLLPHLLKEIGIKEKPYRSKPMQKGLDKFYDVKKIQELQRSKGEEARQRQRRDFPTRVYHSTNVGDGTDPIARKHIKKFGHFPDIFKSDEMRFFSNHDEFDIGFHVSAGEIAAQNRMIRQGENIKEVPIDELQGKVMVPLQLSANINPARLPDVGHFKNPSSWLDNLVSSPKPISELPKGKDYDTEYLKVIDVGGEKYTPSRKFIDLLDVNEYGDPNYPDVYNTEKYLDLWESLVRNMHRLEKKEKADSLKIKDALPTDKKNLILEKQKEIFETIKSVLNKYGFDSIIYENMFEGTDPTAVVGPLSEKSEDSYMLFEPNQAKFWGAEEFDIKNPKLSKKGGGSIVMSNPYNYKPRSI
jgi:hypothetical protein